MNAAPTTDPQGYLHKDTVGPILEAMQDLARRSDEKQFEQYVRYYGIYLTSHHDDAVVERVRQILLSRVSDVRTLRAHDGGIWLRLCDS